MYSVYKEYINNSTNHSNQNGEENVPFSSVFAKESWQRLFLISLLTNDANGSVYGDKVVLRAMAVCVNTCVCIPPVRTQNIAE